MSSNHRNLHDNDPNPNDPNPGSSPSGNRPTRARKKPIRPVEVSPPPESAPPGPTEAAPTEMKTPQEAERAPEPNPPTSGKTPRDQHASKPATPDDPAQSSDNQPPERREVTHEMVAKHFKLSPQQSAVAIQVLEGRTDALIAATLGIEETTVRKHLSRVFRKTNTKGRVQLPIRWCETQRELERAEGAQ